MEWEKGMTITPIELVITPELVKLYAEVSGDHNRLHLDEEFARTTRFGTRIAHGMLLMAVVTEMLMGAFGLSWARSGQLDVSFVAPVPVGSTLHTDGQVTGVSLDQEGYHFAIETWATIDNGQKVLTATGSVLLSSDLI
ncbi:MAG: MaoC family dehydratase [Firmicutes bacterium]|nr:MaoC family dehydratase [Bacillota bacterium]